MTLRMEQVVGELAGYIERYREELAAMNAGLDQAEASLHTWARDPQAANQRIEAAMANRRDPFAIALTESPSGRFAPGPFNPVTVVAADGSSIEPDRFAAVQCFVVNTGYVVLPYGVTGLEPVLGASAVLGPERLPHEDLGRDEGSEDTASRGWGVNLQRDVQELEAAVSYAGRAAPAGEVVTLVDGTLLPWDLDSPDVAGPIRADLQDRTDQALNEMRELGPGVSIGAYVSASRSRELVTSLRALSPDTADRWPESDGHLMSRLLADGERSAVFAARSRRRDRIEEQFTAHQVCFFYLRVGDDIARVELPHWATDSARLDRLQATIVDQCARCSGYPRALQEAHEQAVINGADRLQFSLLLERAAAGQGLVAPGNSKQMSKRRRAL